jgi:hypothetical protein
MNRQNLYYLNDGEGSTFSKDEVLEKLPLPDLAATLERYYKNLLPFGTNDELKNSRKVIDAFKNGTGKKLQKLLQDKAMVEKNWVSVNFARRNYNNFHGLSYLGREILGRHRLSFLKISSSIL